MGTKGTIRRKLIDPDKDRANKRECIMELDNIRKDHQRDLDSARRADHRKQVEQFERARYERNR